MAIALMLASFHERFAAQVIGVLTDWLDCRNLGKHFPNRAFTVDTPSHVAI